MGPLEAAGYRIGQSGIRWLVPENHLCRSGEPIASCSIGLIPDTASPAKDHPFPNEDRDQNLKAVFATRVTGRLRQTADMSRGGFLNIHHPYRWMSDLPIAQIIPTEVAGPSIGDPGLLRLMVLAGRTMTPLVTSSSGLMDGWFDRSRAWWTDDDAGPVETLVSLATCEQIGILQGDRGRYFELFADIAAATQVITVQDVPLVPCARIVVEQLRRTTADRRQIAEDLAQSFLTANTIPDSDDWLFIGALLKALDRSPANESTTILGRSGLRNLPPPRLILMSLLAEGTVVARHRRLGYTVAFHRFRLFQAGPRIQHWLRENFVAVSRSVEDIRWDYLDLLETLRATTGAHLLVLNTQSAPSLETLQTYAGFGRPLADSLASVRSKALNLMLHDLARDHPVTIIDADLALGRRGTREHAPDGVHYSGAIQDDLRAEIARVLRDRARQ